MNGLVKVPYIDKYTGRFYEPGKKVEYPEARIKELAALGVVEIKEAAETKPEVTAVPKPEKKASPAEKTVKKTATKTTTKKKESR